MNTRNFPLGGGLSLTLWETPELYFGPVSVKVWREIMPKGTLRNGLEYASFDLSFDDFRNNTNNLNEFLSELSVRSGMEVELFTAADLGPDLANNLQSKGMNLNSFKVVIRK